MNLESCLEEYRAALQLGESFEQPIATAFAEG